MTEQSDCEASGSDSPLFSNRERGHGNACRHLSDGEQGIEPAKGLTRHGNAQDGKGGQGCGHPREVGRTPSSCNEEAETPFLSGAGVGNEAEGGTVGAYNPNFRWYSRLAKKGVGGLESGPVGPTAHDDADEGAGTLQGVEIKCLSVEVKNFGWD